MDNSSGNWDVYLSDMATNGTEPVYKGPGQQMYPIISGDLVVWQDNRNGDWDVYVKDLLSGDETKLTGEGDQVYPDVSGNTIVWEDGKSSDISYYLWDKKWGKTYPRPGNQTSPVAYGNTSPMWTAQGKTHLFAGWTSATGRTSWSRQGLPGQAQHG